MRGSYSVAVVLLSTSLVPFVIIGDTYDGKTRGKQESTMNLWDSVQRSLEKATNKGV